MSKQLIQLFNEMAIELGENGFDPNAEFEILTTDKQYDSRYGVFSYTKEQLDEMADNFNSNIRGVEIAVDLNHDREKKAYAWIKPESMSVKLSSGLNGWSLYCRLYRYTPEGEELLRTGAFRYFSVELTHKWQRFKDGAKKVFKNVIFGLALTNSPVVKDMMPTFSENLFINNKDMDLFKIYLGELVTKKTISKDEKEVMHKMLAVLSEEEQEEVKEETAQVDALPEEKIKEEETPPAEEEEIKKEVPAKEGAELSEVQKQLSEKELRLAEVETKLRKKELEEKAEQYILSENVSTGLVRKDKGAVVDFIATLSEDQIAEFDRIIGLVRSVKLGEIGSADESKDEDTKEKEARELAEKISKDKNIPLYEALSQAYEKMDLI
jgi:hypothetical protein